MESNYKIPNENEINEFLAITNTSDRQIAIEFLNETNNDLTVFSYFFFKFI